jgi:putative ABC transport system substrate-binding protein
MIGRRAFVVGGGALLAPQLASVPTQSQERVFRIGILSTPSTPRVETHYYAPFREELRRFGYVEGKNLVIDFRGVGDPAQLRATALELAQQKVDVIFASGSSYAAAAFAATRSIPVVIIAGNIVERGFAASHARPGGNVTGIEPVITVGKQIDTLKRILPRLERMAVLDLASHEIRAVIVSEAKRAADKLGIAVDVTHMRSIDDLEATFSELASRRIEAVLVSPHPIFNSKGPEVAGLALKFGMASTSFYLDAAESGALLAYDPDVRGMWVRAATLIDKILRGTPPAEIPIERATRFIFAINLKTAKALGITVPPSILALADRVIE